MSKILGLDLGTNSIGWAVVETEDNENFKLLNKGVRIFQEGVKIKEGVESSKAAERTKFRSSRRLKFRRKLRKINTLRVLIENDFCPYLSIEDLNLWKCKKVYPENQDFRQWLLTNDSENKNPYYYRALASDKKLDLSVKDERYALGRAFYHIAQRRGFLSNRLETTSEKEYGKVKDAINELSQKIEKSNRKTLGQYFYKLYQQGERIRSQYTHREDHYLHEFREICRVQQLSENQVEDIENAIFYQRPLKSQKGLIGKCTFEKKKLRCPVSHPLFEEYRMFCLINNIKIKTLNDEKLRFLNKSERKEIIQLFFRKSKEHFDFEDIAKKLTPKGYKYAYYRSNESANAHFLFNYNLKTAISGCPTSAALKDIFGEDWENIEFSYTTKDKYGNEEKRHANTYDIWHVLFTFDKDEKLKEFAQSRLELDEETAVKFYKIKLKQDYAQLSLKAIKKILPYLREGLIYSYAVFLANIEYIIGKDIWNNKENQRIIRNEIKNIIDNHNEEKRIEEVVNVIIKECKDNRYTADNLEFLTNSYKETIEKKLENSYGEKTWNKKENKQEIINNTFRLFEKQFEKNNGVGDYIKPKRIDEKIKDFLIGNFNADNDAVEKLYHPSDIEIFAQPDRAKDGNLYLKSPRVPSIKNPMALRTMHQLKFLINSMIKKGEIDERTKIHIELARELNNKNKRLAIQSWQRDRENDRNKYHEEIIKLYDEQYRKEINPTDDDILKYQLWVEQEHKCLYTGETIGICEFIGENPKFEIEHTIPRSLSYDNSQENLTLCNNKFNREIKKNKIPSYLHNHDEILMRIENMKN